MNLAIDKEMLIEQNVEGQGVPSATFIIPGSEYDAGIEWSRDVEQAKALLEEAGWDSSQTLTPWPSPPPEREWQLLSSRTWPRSASTSRS